MRRRHLYEDEELDIEDQLDEIEDTDDDKGDTSFNPSQIKSMVSSMVSSEVSRLTKDTPSTDSQKDTSEDKREEVSVDRDTKSGQSDYPSPKPKQDPRKHTPIPPHSEPSYPTHRPPKKPHRPTGHRGNKQTSQPRKVLSKPHYNVVYGHLETINNFPNNRKGLVRFNHHFNGNLIICSPVIEGDNPNIQMKKVLWLRRVLIENQYQYLPIYTYDNHRELIDISFVIFPKGKMKTDYTDLMGFINRFLSELPSHSFIGREDGFYTLYSDHKTIHYTYEDIESLLDNYSKERGISLEEGFRHFLNPVPSSSTEEIYRTKVLCEVCIREKV